MRERCIAEEVIRQLPRENLLSLVSYCAEGLSYLASPIFFSDDLNVPAKIGVFAVRKEYPENGVHVRVMEQTVTVIATPLPPVMRVQVWCRVDWPELQAQGFGPSFTPCEVGADIMRYLLRMVEGNERADAWQPLKGKLTTEFSPVLQEITLSWRISELKRWVEDFRSDTNADILLFHSGAKGYIDIYNEYPRPMVGMRCDRPVNGAIELIPYILEGATPSAIAELQRWHDALSAAMLSTATNNQGVKTIGKYDHNYIPPNLPEELYDFWRDNWIQREAARLSTAYQRTEKAWAETVRTNPPNTVSTNEEAAVSANADAAADEHLRLATLARQYSLRGECKVMPDSIELWERIAELKKYSLTDSRICDRIVGLSLRNLRYHKERMKKTGYWSDCGLPD